jgi:hypothetical protein
LITTTKKIRVFVLFTAEPEQSTYNERKSWFDDWRLASWDNSGRAAIKASNAAHG